MISTIYRLLRTSCTYLKNHPQVIFALALLIIIPILFVYTGQQFLEVGRVNQDSVGKDRVGLLHDALASLLRGTQYDVEITRAELTQIKSRNNDLIDFALVKKDVRGFVYVAARDETLIGTTVLNSALYVNAALRSDESLIFEFQDGEVRYWAAYRAVQSEGGDLYFLYTLFTLEHIDSLFKDREGKAYYSLFFIYSFVIALAYWHIRLTDYRYLFIKEQKAGEMKDIFTHMIAHELRSPLTAILAVRRTSLRATH